MEKEKELPREILDFLRMDGGHSLIMKGDAGTGKTTLALQIIEALEGEQNTLYLSTRVSDSSLYLQFPWLRERVYRNRLLMAAKSFLKAFESSEGVLKAAQNFLKYLHTEEEKPTEISRTELKKLEGDIEGIEEETEMFEENAFVFDIGSDMPEIDLAYDSAESALPQKSLIIFDSIDALSEKYGIPANRLVSTIQKDLVENSSTNVVYILESSGASHLDYLGDGVISMSTGELAGRRYRELIISKLRGYEIKNHRHIITLTGGRITDLNAELPHTQTWEPWKPEPEKKKGDRYSTGTPSFDALLGNGVKKGEVILLEIASESSRNCIDELIYRMIQQFALNGHGISWLPSRRMNREQVRVRMNRDIRFEDIEDNLKIFEYDKTESLNRYLGTQLEGKNVGTDLDWGGVEYALKGKKTPFLSVIGIDTLEAIYGEDAVLGLFEHIGSVKAADGILVLIIPSSDEHLSRMAAVSDYHLVVDSIHGAPVLYGKKPFTPLYGMRTAMKDGNIELELIPIS